MRHLYLLTQKIALTAILVFTSCTTEPFERNISNDIISSERVSCQNKVDKFLASIDSVNDLYKLRTSVISAKAKGSNLAKWVGKFYSALVDGIAGSIATPATSPFGGFAIATAASWAYDEQWQRLMDGRVVSTSEPTPSSHSISDISFIPGCAPDMPSLEDSMGYYHNAVLDSIEKSGKSYTLSGDRIDYYMLYNDCQNIAKKNNFPINNLSPTQLDAYLSITDTIVMSFLACRDNNPLQLSQAFNSINQAYQFHIGNTDDLVITETVQSKIFHTLRNLNRVNEIKEYANVLSSLYNDIQIDPNLRRSIKVMTNITVSSMIYWKQNELEFSNP